MSHVSQPKDGLSSGTEPPLEPQTDSTSSNVAEENQKNSASENGAGESKNGRSSSADDSPALVPLSPSAIKVLEALAQGISQNQSKKFPNHYDDKYPEDPHSQEFGPNSRIYKVYLDEAGKREKEELESWRDSLDVMLVYAGIFAAVVATFIVQFSSRLEPDYAEMNTYLQLENNALLRAMAKEAPAPSVQVPLRSPYTKFAPARIDVWINGLWYLSLTLSLSTALLTGLVKQWLKNHDSYIPGSPQDRARIKEARRRAVDSWRLSAIVGTLPLLIHVSHFIFFTGLSLFLSTEDTTISYIILGTVCFTALIYIFTTILPLIFPHCCYVTPLTSSLYTSWHTAHIIGAVIIVYGRHIVEEYLSKGEPERSSHSTHVATQKLRKAFKFKSISHIKRRKALQDVDLADIHILQWLQRDASLNPSVPPIIREAISGIREGFSQLSAIRRFNGRIIKDWISEISQLMTAPTGTSDLSRVERYLRMNANLYIPDENFTILDQQPNLVRALVFVAGIEKFLPRLHQGKLKCCGGSFENDRTRNTHSYWTHVLLFMCTMGIKGTESHDNPLISLHPGTWVNVFAYLVKFSCGHTSKANLDLPIECIRKCVNDLLPAILSHHFERSEPCHPYFAETSDEKKSGKEKRVGHAVTILELPPGQSRMRFLQFLCVYSIPASENPLNTSLAFPVFIANLLELWHKTLLLHLKPLQGTETPDLANSFVGILRELRGVLEKSLYKQPLSQKKNPLYWKGMTLLFGRRSSAPELLLGELLERRREDLRRELVDATLKSGVPMIDLQALTKQYPSTTGNPSTSTDPAASGVDTVPVNFLKTLKITPLIGVQLVSVIEALYKIIPPWLFDYPNKALVKAGIYPAFALGYQVYSTPTSYLQTLKQVNETLLTDILFTIFEIGTLSSRDRSHSNLEQSTAESHTLYVADDALAALNRLLEFGSDIFISSKGIKLIFNMLNKLSNVPPQNMGLAIIFKATQLVSSFVAGVLKVKSPDSAEGEGLRYLCEPETLNMCCKIIAWSEYANYVLQVNAEAEAAKSSYAALTKLRSITRSHRDKWWQNILTITDKFPQPFKEAWKQVFREQTLQPERPTTASREELVSSYQGNSIQIRISDLPSNFALYKKRRYVWWNDILAALGLDHEWFSDYQLNVYLTPEERDYLPPFTKWRVSQYVPIRDRDRATQWELAEFDSIRDHVNEDLIPVKDPHEKELETFRKVVLDASSQRRSQNENGVANGGDSTSS